MKGVREQTLRHALSALGEPGHTPRYAVLGAGHGGLCMAGHLGLMGFHVGLWNRTDEQLNAVRWNGGVLLSGAVNGFGVVHCVSSDLSLVLSQADIIMVVTPATAHRDLARRMVPYLRDGQIIILNPGRTGGALEVDHYFRRERPELAVIVGETQTFLYASRAVNRAEGHIYKIKNRVPLATLPASWIPDVLSCLGGAFPGFVAGGSVLCTSLDNIGAVFHPVLTLLNASWIESTDGDFEYYHQGVSPAIGRLLEAVDAERVAVAAALGVQTVSAREWLYRSYEAAGPDLCSAIRNTSAYKGIKAPASIAHRYLYEDIPMSLAPLASLGRMLGVKTPYIDMIIQLGSTLLGVDLLKGARDVESMGLAGLSIAQIQLQSMGFQGKGGVR